MATIRPLSVEATPRKVRDLILSHDLAGKRILDLGAGQGYLTRAIAAGMTEKRLPLDSRLFAADLDPANFQFDGITCDYGDFNDRLPYPDGYFDFVCFVEVIEHLENQFSCIREIARILKPGGTAYITTPNILNMNSRIRFFAGGLFFQFDVLPHRMAPDPASLVTGHVNPIDYAHLAHICKRNGMESIAVHVDRRKTSAVAWAVFLFPLIRASGYLVHAYQRAKVPEADAENADILANLNSFDILTSRSLVLECTKAPGDSPTP